MIPLVDLKAQYKNIKEEVLECVQDVFENSQFILGPHVANFEKSFQEYCQAPLPAVAVNSGTSALHLAMLASDVGLGDEVITVPMTFIATVSAIRYTGAKPVFVDIDPKTWNMDADALEVAVTERTKAIVPVHMHGRVCDMSAIRAVAEKYNLVVIEDAAQAHGAEYKGARAGSLADFSCFSFYAGKNLGAYGEGGAVFAQSMERHKKISMLRDWGSEQKYLHELQGYNYRMEGVQGAVLGVKMKYLDKWTDLRGQHAGYYSKRLKNLDLILPEPVSEGDRHAWHIYCIKTQARDQILKEMHSRQIGVGMHYPIPLHLQPCMRDLGYSEGDFPHSEEFCKTCLSLPLFPELEKSQLDQVCNTLEEICHDLIT